MLVTTTLLFIVMSRIWKWRLWVAVSLTLCFLIIDLTFVCANLIKVVDGGWASLVVAFLIVLVMFTWVRGSRQLFEKTRKGEVPLDLISKKMAENPPTLVPGTAVFLTGDPKEHTNRADAQSQTLQGLASEQCDIDRGYRSDAASEKERPCADRANQRPVYAGHANVWLHGTSQHPPDTWRSAASKAGSSTS